jgi:hypothetical protein
MRPIAFLGLLLLLAGCVPPVPDNMRREALAPQPIDNSPPPSAPAPIRPSALGYGGAPPRIPSGGLGAEAPMPMPSASKMPTISARPGVPSSAGTASGGAGQSIMVPNGNGTTTIIHPDGTIETIPTPK